MNAYSFRPYHAALALLLFISLVAPVVNASNRIDFDARTPSSPHASTGYVASSYVSPSGHVIGVNRRYLTLDGKPWLPVMGEIHYSCIPASDC